MKDQEKNEELLSFFKALADGNRLKIVGLLAQEDLTVEQMAEMLNITASTVSHHLSKLSKAGLVTARAESYYSIYHLETRSVEEMAQRLLHRETLPAIASDVDMDAYDRKVLNTYLNRDQTIKDFPVQQKKLEAILRFVAEAFEPEKRYSEKQVNEILSRYNEDTARLRRNLVEFGFMQREGGGGAYWRA
jgi:DNA-binding HxlR family transcriptional regulator